jgi:ATP-dependent helicase HepA
LLRRFGDELVQIAAQDGSAREPAISELIARTRETHAQLAGIIANGRDRLLELGSRRGAADSALLSALHEDDDRAAHDEYPLRLLEAFGIHNEPLSGLIYLLDPEHAVIDGFEELKSGPRQVCFDRNTALARDDLLYLRGDHPLLRSAQEMLLSGETGNAAFLIDDSLPPRSAVLEAVHVLECVAPSALNVERFLPPSPVSVAIDTRLQVRPAFAPGERASLRAGERVFDLTPMRKVLATLVPPMLERAREETGKLCETRIATALAGAQRLLDAEIVRLRALAKINPAVRPEEIAALEHEREQLLAALPNARPRLDALRLVVSPDFLSLRR